MEIIFVDSFDCSNCSPLKLMGNISRHCHLTPSDEIYVYSRTDDKKILTCISNEITYPKVVYADNLEVFHFCLIPVVLPDLSKVGNFKCNIYDIDDFGKIKEINYFFGLNEYLKANWWVKKPSFKCKCKPLGDDMYRFTSKKGSWDIKINDYN